MATIENFLLRFKVDGQQNIDRAAQGIRNLSQQVGQLGANTGPIGGVLDGILGRLGPLGLAASAVATAFAGLAARGIQLGDALGDVSDATGISAGSLLTLRNSIADAGGRAEQFADIATRLNRSVKEAAAGNEGLQDSFRTLGVYVTDAGGNVRSTESILKDIIERFRSGQLSAGQYAAAIKLLGENISKLDVTKLDATGNAITDEKVANITKMTGEIDRLKNMIENLALTIGGSLAGAVNRVVDRFEQRQQEIADRERQLNLQGRTSRMALPAHPDYPPLSGPPQFYINREMTAAEREAFRIQELDRLNAPYRPRPTDRAPGTRPAAQAQAQGGFGAPDPNRIRREQEARERALQEFRQRLAIQNIENDRQRRLQSANEIQTLEINAAAEIARVKQEISARQNLTAQERAQEAAAREQEIQLRLQNDIQRIRQRQASEQFSAEEEQREQNRQAIAAFEQQLQQENLQRIQATQAFAARLEQSQREQRRQQELASANELQTLKINADEEIARAHEEIYSREFLSDEQRAQEFAQRRAAIEAKLATDSQRVRQTQIARQFQMEEEQREQTRREISMFEAEQAREAEQRARQLQEFRQRLEFQTQENLRQTALAGANQIQTVEINAAAEIARARQEIYSREFLSDEQKAQEFAARRATIETRTANEVAKIRNQALARQFESEEEQREQNRRDIIDFENKLRQQQAEAARLARQIANETRNFRFELNQSSGEYEQSLKLQEQQLMQQLQMNSASEDEVRRQEFINRLNQDLDSRKARILSQIEKLKHEQSLLTDEETQQNSALSVRLVFLNQQLDILQRIFNEQSGGLIDLYDINQRNRQLESQRIRDLEYTNSLIDQQVKSQQTLEDILRKAALDRRSVGAGPETAGLGPIGREIARVRYESEQAALAASQAFASTFEDSGDGLTPERAQQLAQGLEQIRQAFRGIADAQVENIAKFKTFEEQLTDAFGKYAEEALDTNRVIQDGFEKTTQGLEDAFVELALTGKITFKNMANSILADLARIAFRRAIVFAGSALFGLPIPGRAQGGPVDARSPYIVGEQGPELFVPTTAGRIVPNNQLSGPGAAGMGQTTVNYNIHAVDAASFRALVARDPSFIYSVTEKGRRSQPTAARRMA